MKNLLHILGLSLLSIIGSGTFAQTVIVQESFETDGEGSRYTSNSGNTAPGGNDIWARTNLNPAPHHSQAITAGTRDGSYYWAGEAVHDPMLNGGADGFMTLNAINVAGYSSLDVQIALGMSRFGQTRWERNDVLRVEYNMDGAGWNIVGLFRGNNPLSDFSGGELAQETDNNEATYGPYGTVVNGTFADFTLPIPVTGNSLQVRVTGGFLGSEEVGFDNIRVRGILTANSAPVLASIEGTALAYSEGDGATQITSTITVSDSDDTNLTSATVSIGSGFDNTEDVLAFTASGGISGSYNSTSGVLSLSGNASLANYQTVLRSVTYQNTDAVDASPATRTIGFQVNDGTDNSNLHTRNITVATSLNTTPLALPFTESFETNLEGARYGSNHFTSGCTFAERGAAGTNVGGCFAEILTGADGSFVWNTESTDANGGFELTSQPLDISGLGPASLTLGIMLAVSRDDESRWESDDQVRVEYNIDGGAYVIAGLFTGNVLGLGGDLYQDLDNDPGTFGPFGASAVPDVFTSYSFNFTGTGNTMTYRIVVNSNGTEELAFDRVSVEGVALPVELVDFTVNKLENGHTALRWETVSETNNKGFHIERRTDVNLWQDLGFVEGQGTTTNRVGYTFIDDTPVQGLSYYRLKQIDFNGNYEYSPTVSVNYGLSESRIQVYPNPTSDFLTIKAEIEDVEVKLYELNGKLLLTKTDNILDLRNFVDGMYFVKIRDRKNHQVFVERIMIRKE